MGVSTDDLNWNGGVLLSQLKHKVKQKTPSLSTRRFYLNLSNLVLEELTLLLNQETAERLRVQPALCH
jgi:hypothetical protein